MTCSSRTRTCFPFWALSPLPLGCRCTCRPTRLRLVIVLATGSTTAIECRLGGTFVFAFLLATLTFRAFLRATFRTSAICRTVAFLATILAHVSSFGTCSFTVLAHRDGVSVHRDKLEVLSVVQVAQDFSPQTFVVAQIRGVQHQIFLQRSFGHLSEDAALDVIGQLQRCCLFFEKNVSLLSSLRDRTVEFIGVERAWLQKL